MQSEVAAHLLHQSSQNLGLMLAPMFSYKKSGVWPLEKHALSMLADRSLCVDKSWSLLFTEQRDKRDARPLQYRGRFFNM